MPRNYASCSPRCALATGPIALLAGIALAAAPAALSAQTVLFDFNSAPIHTSLPIDLTVGGITAHFSATGQGFSIQDTSAPGVPSGFSGRLLYPNSVFKADLLIGFDHVLTDFSIRYAPQELGCDDSATMRVTATMNGVFVGTNTKTASNPGTWPIDTLSCSFPKGFNAVVVHYDSKPPTCQDYGVIFMADDMIVTTHGHNYGAGSTGCSGSQVMVAETAISISQPSFMLGTTDCPPFALGLAFASSAPLNPPQDPFGLGVLFDVDLLGGLEASFFNIYADSTGYGSVTVSTPINPALLGMTFYVQSMWSWPYSTACAQAGNWHPPYGLSTSNGLAVTIGP